MQVESILEGSKETDDSLSSSTDKNLSGPVKPGSTPNLEALQKLASAKDGGAAGRKVGGWGGKDAPGCTGMWC